MSRRRGYRELQADAARGTVTCPHCHTTFTSLDGVGYQPKPVAPPDGFPALTPEQLGVRLVEHRTATERLHGALRQVVSPSTFSLWLSSLRLVGASGETLYALVPVDVADWVRDRFAGLLNETASALAGRPMTVVVAADGGAS